MTWEEFNRAMDFIVQQQAQFSITLENDHKWAKSVIGQLAANDKRIAELIEISTQRLEQREREHREFEQRNEQTQMRAEEFQRESLKLQREALARLDRILHKLTDENHGPN